MINVPDKDEDDDDAIQIALNLPNATVAGKQTGHLSN